MNWIADSLQASSQCMFVHSATNIQRTSLSMPAKRPALRLPPFIEWPFYGFVASAIRLEYGTSCSPCACANRMTLECLHSARPQAMLVSKRCGRVMSVECRCGCIVLRWSWSMWFGRTRSQYHKRNGTAKGYCPFLRQMLLAYLRSLNGTNVRG